MMLKPDSGQTNNQGVINKIFCKQVGWSYIVMGHHYSLPESPLELVYLCQVRDVDYL